MSSNPALYRYINFIGGNILDASNVTLLQTLLAKTSAQGLGQYYAQGTLLNAIFNITGTSIVFTHSNTSYDIFAFINGQFEDIGATVSITGAQPTTGTANPLYLNWSWDIKTSVDDSTFVDGTTGEPTIAAGQLSFNVSWTDTSGVALNTNTQYGKNTTPIILANFDMSVPGAVTPTYINGVAPYGWGNPHQAGLTRLTDTSGLAPGNTDSRLSDARDPLPASVYNASIAALISSGTNSSSLSAWATATIYTVGAQVIDNNGNVETVVNTAGSGTSGGSAPSWNVALGGTTIDNAGANQITWVNGGTASTTKYDPATVNQGGIFTDSIIYTTLKEKLTTFLDSVNTAVENALIALTNHIGKPLGSPATHPFPTAFQVGAAPSSHVGQPLGLGTSHPAQVNSDHAGFVVLRNPLVAPLTPDYAYQLTDGTNTLAGVKHTGDLFSLLANVANAQGGNGAGGTATYTGTLGLVSLIANVLAEHVNYKSHGNNNPHNLNALDLGAVSKTYVDTQDAGVLSSSEAYTNSMTGASVRIVTTNGPTLPTLTPLPSAGGAAKVHWPLTNATITYIILKIGLHFEIAFGFGTYAGTQQVALPETSGWSSSNWYGVAATARPAIRGVDGKDSAMIAYVNTSTRIVMAEGVSDNSGADQNCVASVVAIGWRSI